MWDISGWDNFPTELPNDFNNNIKGELDLLSSPAYAHQNGKPVVCVWGIGFPDRPGSVDESINLINWLKDQGFYVIGGVPREWRTGESAKPGFLPVFTTLDMIQPWTVGGLHTVEGAADYGKRVKEDQDFLTQNGLGMTFL